MSILVIKHQLAKNDTLAASHSDANTFAVPLTICPAPVNVQEIESQASALTEQRHADYDAANLATRYYNLLG